MGSFSGSWWASAPTSANVGSAMMLADFSSPADSQIGLPATCSWGPLASTQTPQAVQSTTTIAALAEQTPTLPCSG